MLNPVVRIVTIVHRGSKAQWLPYFSAHKKHRDFFVRDFRRK